MTDIGIGVAGRRRNPVTTFLRGTRGGLVDFRDWATMWQDAAGTVPVTAVGQPVGLIRSRGPVADWTFSQTSDAARPIVTAGGVAFSGAQWMDGSPAVREVARAAGKVFLAARVKFGSLATNSTYLGFSTNATVPRAVLRVLTAGALFTATRTLDADAQATLTSAGGIVTTGVWYDTALLVDYAGGGVTIRRDAALVASGAPPASALATSDTASAVVRIGGSVGASPVELLNGDVAWLMLADRLPSVDFHNTMRTRLQ